jgi:hypothetical protein
MEDRPMNESPPRPRRSLVVVLLDAMLGLVTAVQTGNLPGVRGGGTARRRRAGMAWLVAGVLAAVGGTAILVSALLRAPDGLAALPPAGVVAAPAPTSGAAVPSATRPSPTSASPSASATSSSRPSRTSASAAVPSSAAASSGGSLLVADYAAAEGGGLLGYRASVTLTSRGPDDAVDWQLTITLPRSTLRIAAVTGATVVQDGAVWTFTPVESTERIPAGVSVDIAFEVRGATLLDATPTACVINDDPCAGLDA